MIWLFRYLKGYLFIEMYLFYNDVFISAVEQRDSVRHKYKFLYSFPLLFITGY